MSQPTPIVSGDTLTYEQNGQTHTLAVGSDAWVAWLATATSFAVVMPGGHFTARKERASSGRGGWYWRAYRKRGATIRRAYLGKDTALTFARLEAAAAQLAANDLPPPNVTPPSDAAAPAGARPVADLQAHPAGSLDPLVATKLAVPPLPASIVVRSHLVDQVAAAAQAPLAIVTAPAGFGKTTLLAEWLHAKGFETGGLGLENATQASSLKPQVPHVAWVSLDTTDSSPIRFWSCVAAAIDQSSPGTGAGAIDLINREPPPPLASIVGKLINSIAAQPGESVLVLDDYHIITTPAVHESLALLLDRIPPGLHVVIASRAAPPLPLAKMRAQGRLAELSADDLRFRVDEAAELLNRAMGLDLAAGEVAELRSRTEGWAVGLRLAGLALHRRERPADFISAFGGTHRYVFDYLADEVLSRQPEHIQLFLLHTAMLDRLCGELCDSVLGLEASDLRLGRAIEPSLQPLASSLILKELERANLFLTPLDEERRWYRYHALFADFLRERQRQLYPERIAELHRRAAEWHEAGGMVAPALDHALAAGDDERVARLVEGRAGQMLARRETATLLAWLGRLPEPLLRARPRLCLAYAAALLIDGRPGEIEPYLLAAVRAQPADLRPGAVQNLLGEVAALRAAAAALAGNIARAIALSHQALEFLPPDNTLVRGFAAASLGIATLASGEVVRASQTLADAAVLSQSAGNAYLTLVSLCSLAYLQVAQGQLRTAAETYRRALRQAEELGGELMPVAGWATVGLAGLHYEWNDLDTAFATVGKGIERCQQWGSLAPLLIGYSVLARIQHARGDVQAARGTVAQARQRAEAANARRLLGLLDALDATLQVGSASPASQGLAAATQWAATCDLRDDWSSFEHGSEHIALARVLIAQSREWGDQAAAREAASLLHTLQQAAEAAGWAGRLIQIQVLQALAAQALGDTAGALAILEQALVQAMTEGYMRVFVDEGAPMAALLAQYAKRQARNTPVGEYVWRLRAAFARTEDGGQATEAFASPQHSALVEPLTERELGILRRIAAGHSPAAIARELFLAPSTVKWHLKAIYHKLDVHTRTAAVAAARALGLLH